MKIFSYFILFLLIVGFCSADVVDKATGESFPGQVSFDDYTLNATGVSTRKKLMFKVYSVASYLQENGDTSGDKFQQIMNPKNAKQLILVWVRDVDAAKVQGGFKNSLKSNAAPAAETDTFVSFFSDVSKGDKHVLRWIPGDEIEVEINGSSAGTIKNEAFAKALWMIWFGNKSVVKRDQLVSLM